jgi:hypothetical protein
VCQGDSGGPAIDARTGAVLTREAELEPAE